jgi:hypothetical protein
MLRSSLAPKAFRGLRDRQLFCMVSRYPAAAGSVTDRFRYAPSSRPLTGDLPDDVIILCETVH